MQRYFLALKIVCIITANVVASDGVSQISLFHMKHNSCNAQVIDCGKGHEDINERLLKLDPLVKKGANQHPYYVTDLMNTLNQLVDDVRKLPLSEKKIGFLHILGSKYHELGRSLHALDIYEDILALQRNDQTIALIQQMASDLAKKIENIRVNNKVKAGTNKVKDPREGHFKFMWGLCEKCLKENKVYNHEIGSEVL